VLPDPLWPNDDAARWSAAVAQYDRVIDGQGVTSLPAHERWYADELAAELQTRAPAHVTHAELVRITEWKMARGVWRARNLVLVRGNDAALVHDTSVEAFALMPHDTKPIARLATLAGVGPATASAVLSAMAPERYPFFDELVAAQIPALGPVKFTLGYYARYADALRDRASGLGADWTPARVERALWAHVGGKAGRDSSEDAWHGGHHD
jgi:hypothetical protein